MHNEPLPIGKFLFVHDILKPEQETKPGYYTFSGHVHPGITLRGRGRQSLRFPCFYFAKEYCLLPAFSRFTGTYPVAPQKNEKVFAVVEKEIVPMHK